MLGIDKGNIIIVQEPYASKIREALRNADREARERYEYLKAKGYFKNIRLQGMPFEIVPVTKQDNFMTRMRDFLVGMTLQVK